MTVWDMLEVYKYLLVLVNRGIKGFQVLGISMSISLREDHVEKYNFRRHKYERSGI